MQNDPVKAALDQTLEILKELLAKKAKAQLENALIDMELARLRPKLIGLAALSDEPPKDEYFDLFIRETAGRGLTDAIRDTLMGDGGFMSPIQVRDALIRANLDITAKYANPLAVIHNILKRFIERKRVIQRRTSDRKLEYKWNPDARLTRREVRLLEERQPEWWKCYMSQREENANAYQQAAKALGDLKRVTLPDMPPPQASKKKD